MLPSAWAWALIQEGALWAMRDAVPADLPPRLRPLGLAVLTGCICSTLFSLTPLLRLLAAPPLRVIRRDAGMGKLALAGVKSDGSESFADGPVQWGLDPFNQPVCLLCCHCDDAIGAQLWRIHGGGGVDCRVITVLR